MNLYLFNDNDSAATYGIGTYLKELTQALEGTPIHPYIIHLHSVRPVFEIDKTNHVENWYVPEIRNDNAVSVSAGKMENYCRNITYLLRLYVKDTKDLVFHFNFNQYQFLAKELKSIFDCKTVTTVHFTKWSLELLGNTTLLHMLKSKSENQRSLYEQLLLTTDEYESFLYKAVDKVIALSDYTRNHLCSEYQLNPAKITVIPNGLEDINPLMETDKDVLRRKWRISEKEFLILYVGRLQAVKGLIFLIKDFREVLEKIPDCRLIIAGNGELDVYLKEAKDICTKVTFTGLLEKQELGELYQIADVGVVPSLFETFGYVAVEMMMHGLPVVTTATSGLNEVVDESCGIKVPLTVLSDSVEIETSLLAQKIIYLLQHPVEAKRLGRNARQRYLEKYSLPVFKKNMLHFYESLYPKQKENIN